MTMMDKREETRPHLYFPCHYNRYYALNFFFRSQHTQKLKTKQLVSVMHAVYIIYAIRIL